MSLLKENISQSMDSESFRLPPRLGRKRRSSILKPQRPFTDVQNLSRDVESRDRRVSFCPTIEVKEFNKHKPAGPSSGSDRVTRSSGEDGVLKQVNLPTPEVADKIQMSTPVKRKKRRISASQVDRFSIIPKFEKSFTFFPEDNDFTVFDDDVQGHTPPATARLDEITLFEELPDPQFGDIELPKLEDDIMLDVALKELESSPSATSSHPKLTKCPLDPVANSLFSTALPLQSSPAEPPVPAMPVVASEDAAEKLVELLPQAAAMPTATVPTMMGTPPAPSHSYYLAWPTPENLSGSPPNLRHNVTTAVGSEMEIVCEEASRGLFGGVASMELTGSNDSTTSPVSHLPRGLSEPRSISFACLGTNAFPSSVNPVVSQADYDPVPMTLTCQIISTRSCTDSEPHTRSELVSETTHASLPGGLLGGVEVNTGGDGGRDTPPTSAGGTGAEGGDMTSAVGSSPLVLGRALTVRGPRASQGVQSLLEAQETRDSQMDMTCMSETLQTSTVASPSVTNATPALEVAENLDDVSAVQPAGPPTSPVFKHPKRPLRSQLKLKSSGRKVVKASPVVRTPHTASNALQGPRSILPKCGSITPSLAHPAHHSTFTITPLRTTTTTITAASATCAEELHVHVPTASAPPPSTTHSTRTPLAPSTTHSTPTPLTPSLSLTAELGTYTSPFLPPSSSTTAHAATAPSQAPSTSTAAETEVISHPLLASPLLSGHSSMLSAPPHADSAWLQSSGDSFNLVNSGDNTLGAGCTTQESLSHSDGSLTEQPELDESGSDKLQQVNTSTHMEIAASTHQSTIALRETAAASSLLQPHSFSSSQPLVSCNPRHCTPHVNKVCSQSARMAKALQQLRVSGPHVPAVSVETPESALVEVPPVPNDSLHISALHVTMNDTTLCGRSMLLSPSIYEKFVAQICNEGTQQPATSTSLSPPHISLRPLHESGSREQPPASTQQPGHSSPPHRQCSSPSPVPGPLFISSMALTGSEQATSSTLFSDFISDLTFRLHDMLQGVQQRLSCADYASAHRYLSPVLDTWSRVLSACLGTLTTLQQYGELSGASHTHSWSSEGVPADLPLPPIGQEDMEDGLSRKVEWIMELIASYNTLLPIAQVARDEAAMLYGWHFEEWSYDLSTQHVTVSVQSKQLHFHLSVSDIVADRISSTGRVARAVWDLMQTGSTTCALMTS